MESIGIVEKKREKRKSEKLFRFGILKIDYDQEMVLCQKHGNYDFGEFFNPYTWFDERGKIRKKLLSPARFEVPLKCFSFGPPVAERQFERLTRGPPEGGKA